MRCEIAYIPVRMTSVTQDPIDRFTLRIEELRRVPTGHGPARLVHNLILDIFMSMLRLFASLAEQVRTGTLPTGTLPTGTLPTGTLPTGTLPDTAPAPRGGGSPRHGGAPDSPRVRPPELLARQIPEAASNGRTTHGLFEQPEMPPEIKQPIAEAPQLAAAVPDARGRAAAAAAGSFAKIEGSVRAGGRAAAAWERRLLAAMARAGTAPECGRRVLAVFFEKRA